MNQVANQKCDLGSVLARKVIAYIRPKYPIYRVGYYELNVTDTRVGGDDSDDEDRMMQTVKTEYITKIVEVLTDLLVFEEDDWVYEMDVFQKVSTPCFEKMQESLTDRRSMTSYGSTYVFVSIERVA